MSEAIEVQSAVIPYIKLVLNGEDEQGNPVVNEYKLVYDYRAIARAEESVKVDLKSFEAWKKITSAMTPQLVHAGLAKHHPEVTLDQIQDKLNPGVQRPLQEALFDALFPGVMDTIRKLRAEEEKSRATGASPNAESGASVA